jgi:hypothetical protein
MVTDGRMHDWWDLAGDEPRWVRELMREHAVRALPRTPEVLGSGSTGVSSEQRLRSSLRAPGSRGTK